MNVPKIAARIKDIDFDSIFISNVFQVSRSYVHWKELAHFKIIFFVRSFAKLFHSLFLCPDLLGISA